MMKPSTTVDDGGSDPQTGVPGIAESRRALSAGASIKGVWFTTTPLCGVIEPGTRPVFETRDDGSLLESRQHAVWHGLGANVVIGTPLWYAPGSHVLWPASMAIKAERRRGMQRVGDTMVFACPAPAASGCRVVLPEWAVPAASSRAPLLIGKRADEGTAHIRNVLRVGGGVPPLTNVVLDGIAAATRFNATDTAGNAAAISRFAVGVVTTLAALGGPSSPPSPTLGINTIDVMITFSSWTALHSGSDIDAQGVVPRGARVTVPIMATTEWTRSTGEVLGIDVATVTTDSDSGGDNGSDIDVDIELAAEVLLRFGAVVVRVPIDASAKHAVFTSVLQSVARGHAVTGVAMGANGVIAPAGARPTALSSCGNIVPVTRLVNSVVGSVVTAAIVAVKAIHPLPLGWRERVVRCVCPFWGLLAVATEAPATVPRPMAYVLDTKVQVASPGVPILVPEPAQHPCWGDMSPSDQLKSGGGCATSASGCAPGTEEGGDGKRDATMIHTLLTTTTRAPLLSWAESGRTPRIPSAWEKTISTCVALETPGSAERAAWLTRIDAASRVFLARVDIPVRRTGGVTALRGHLRGHGVPPMGSAGRGGAWHPPLQPTAQPPVSTVRPALGWVVAPGKRL